MAERTFHLTGIENAQIAKDRSRIDLNLRTADGPVTLSLDAGHLDHFLTCLHGIEHHLSLLDPVKGPLAGEQQQFRTEIVEYHRIGHGIVNGTPSVFVGLRCPPNFRYYALDARKAAELSEGIAAEIPKLDTVAGAN